MSDLREALRESARLLQRYVTETPLGHQPHMIAHEAKASIRASLAVLSAEPAQPKALTDELLYDLIVGALEDRGAAWLMDDDDEFSQAKAILHVARAVIAADRASRLPELTDAQIDSMIEAHVGGNEITDDEYASAKAFARKVEALVRGKT